MFLEAALVALASSHLVAASSKLFFGATIVALEETTESFDIIRNGALLVTDDRIAGLYDNTDPKGIPEDTERIDVSGQIITPGFIDTHRHGWQTAFKTIASNATLAEYMQRHGQFAALGKFTARDVYLGQLTGLWESLNGGVTTSLDHAHHIWSYETAYGGLNATIESGARVFWAYAFQNMPNYGINEQIPHFREIAESNIFDNSPSELSIAFDGWGPMPNVEEVKRVTALAQEYRVSAITTHCLMGPWGQMNTPADVHRFGMLSQDIPVVFSHASYMDASNAALLRAENQYFSITPESEMHFGHLHPTAHLYQDKASLGVDTHYTFSADILTQARLWLQSARYRLFQAVLDRGQIPTSGPMTVAQAFHLATRAGGLALRRPDLGVIRVGAKADIVVWNARTSPAMLGWVDPVAAVILHANVGDVLDVMVDGKFIKRDGKMLASNYEKTRKDFIASAKKIQDKWLNIPYPVLEGKWFGTADYGQPQDIGSNSYGLPFLQRKHGAKTGEARNSQDVKDEL